GTGDKKIRGSSRCGFVFVSYRGPHPVSNELAQLRTSVLIVGPARRVHGSTLPRSPVRSLPRPPFRAAAPPLHRESPARAVRRAVGSNPFSSSARRLDLAPPARAIPAPAGCRPVVRSANRVPRNHFAESVLPPV